MKRILTILTACLLLAALACAKQPEAAPADEPSVSAPGEIELTLTLPLGTRDEIAKTIPGFTGGFRSADDAALRFSVESADEGVAEGVLSDGTLYVFARGVGETVLTVLAETETGETARATVSVSVRDARRTLVLIAAAALAVLLLILLGKPVKKDSADENATSPAVGEEAPPVVIEEDPKEDNRDSENR